MARRERLTVTQRAILDCVVEYWRDYGYAPTYREIGEAVDEARRAHEPGYKGRRDASSLVAYNIEKLADMGYVTYRPRTMRSIRLTPISSPEEVGRYALASVALHGPHTMRRAVARLETSAQRAQEIGDAAVAALLLELAGAVGRLAEERQAEMRGAGREPRVKRVRKGAA